MYVEMPFITSSTSGLKNKIKHLTNKLRPDLDIQFFFKPPPSIQTFFQTKDPIAKHIQSDVVYYIKCNDCEHSYLGKTERQCIRRLYEHGAPTTPYQPQQQPYILDEYGTARRNALVRGFIDALTRGGPGGTPRPIELSSHDPLRYVGDMLAWTHQSTASEKEYAEILLRKLKDWNELQKTIQTLLGYITEGLCRPLRVRLEQVLVSQHEPVTLYKLTNLLKFYETTIKQLLPIECQLVLVLDEVSNLSSKMFLNALNATATRLIEKVDMPTNDLNLSDELRRTLALLRDILETHSTSMIPFESKRIDFQQIVYSIIDPLLQMCSLSAAKLGVIEMAVYLVNCISAIRTTLAVFAFTDEKIEMLEGQIDANTDTLIGEQATYILLRTDLLDAYRVVEKQQQESNDNVTALALKPGMDTVTLKAAMVKFDSYLASPDLYIMPQLKYLTSAVIREKIKKRSVELICAAYTSLYSAIMNSKNNYANPYSIMPHTPEQIVKLLS
ncbi:unnamed protein product [Rotaria sp. Silwood2]|nr:unnamed protein product [Rotaria sp. Silwood2]